MVIVKGTSKKKKEEISTKRKERVFEYPLGDLILFKDFYYTTHHSDVIKEPFVKNHIAEKSRIRRWWQQNETMVAKKKLKKDRIWKVSNDREIDDSSSH